MVNNKIKVGFCIAYDWYFLKHALPLVYDDADAICLSLDKERISWGGEKFLLDNEAFRNFIQQTDTLHKIRILEEDFHLPELSAAQNEVRQRNRMGEFMQAGGWHIQLDCDEYFIDFAGFVSWLKSLPFRDRTRTNICCPWLVLYKQTRNGFLYVHPKTREQVEFIQIATQNPSYSFGRRNGDFNVYTSFGIIHQSWARSEQEILQKLSNWGHKDDFDSKRYFDVWKNVNENNFQQINDFHPMQPTAWSSLQYAHATDIPGFLHTFSWSDFPFTKRDLRLKNSRLLAKVKKALRIIMP